MPQAVGDNVPRGGRSGEPKARTGGAAGSSPGRFAPGAEGGKRGLLRIQGDAGRDAQAGAYRPEARVRVCGGKAPKRQRRSNA